MSLADDLTTEFRDQAGLKKHDAAVAAFIVMAYCCGWPHAQIGRYTGVSRARIGQKIDKYREYIEELKMPILARLFDNAVATQVKQSVVAFQQADWKNDGFREGMLSYIEKRIEI